MTRALQLVAAAAALTQGVSAGSVQLPITFRNTYSMVEVSAGTPGESHYLLFDTGSGSTWIVDKKCATGGGCKNNSGFQRVGYEANASSTSTDLGVYDETTFLGGKIGGPAMADMFHVDGVTWNQTFIAANESDWINIPGDGFFAMAFSSIAENSTKTVVETMIEQGLLDEPRFAIYYGDKVSTGGNGNGGGAITIGKSEEEKYVDGELTWLPVKFGNDGNFQLWSSKLRVMEGSYKSNNGTEVASPLFQWEENQAMAVFDTGAGTIGVPDNSVDAFYHAIGWPGMDALLNRSFKPLCSYFNSTWGITLTMSDEDGNFHNLTITGDQMKGLPGFAHQDDECNPPFEGSGSNGLMLIGAQYLSHVYSVYDFGATEVANYWPKMAFGKLKKEYTF